MTENTTDYWQLLDPYAQKSSGGSTIFQRHAYTSFSTTDEEPGRMTHDPQQLPPLFHVNMSSDAHMDDAGSGDLLNHQFMDLLQQLVDGQERQNQLLEDMNEQLCANQRQRAAELGQWKQANPKLARRCRKAAESLSRVQTEFLENLIDEVTGSADEFMDSDFMLNEFVDRFGPRLAHLNGVLQVLSQLSSVSSNTSKAHGGSN